MAGAAGAAAPLLRCSQRLLSGRSSRQRDNVSLNSSSGPRQAASPKTLCHSCENFVLRTFSGLKSLGQRFGEAVYASD